MMLARTLISLVMLTFASACANTPVSDAAVCAGCADARRALAAALIEDGGAQSQRAGLVLLDKLKAGCG